MSDFKTLPDAPAFPEIHIYHWREKNEEGHEQSHVLPRYMSGMTKREYLAALALPAAVQVVRDFRLKETSHETVVARTAIHLADALIEELNK